MSAIPRSLLVHPEAPRGPDDPNDVNSAGENAQIVFSWDIGHGVMTCSERASAEFVASLPVGIVTEKEFESLWLPEDVTRLRQFARRARGSNVSLVEDLVFTTASDVERTSGYDVALRSIPQQAGECQIRVVLSRRDEAARPAAASDERQALVSELAEVCPVPMLIYDSTWRVVYMNPAFEKLFGYRPEQLPNLHAWHELAFPDPRYRERALSWRPIYIADSDAIQAAKKLGVERTSPAASVLGQSFQVRTARGDYLAIRPMIRRIGADGRYSLLLLENRTPEWEHEASLLERETFLRATSDSVPAMLARWSAEQRCEFVNTAFAKWAGRSREALLGLSAREILGEDLYPRIESFFGAACKGDTLETEQSISLAPGEPQVAQIRFEPIGIPQGGFAVLTMFSDITALWQARIKAFQNETRYRSFFQCVPDPAFVVDVSGAIIECNLAAQSLIGLGEDSLLRRSIVEALEAVDAKIIEANSPQLGEVILSMFRDPTVATRRVEVRVGRRDRLWMLRSSPVPSDAGGAGGWIVVIHDQTSDVHLDRLETERAVSQQAALAKNDFINSLAHEIRTPLNSVMGYTQLALRSESLDAQLRQKLGWVLSGAQQIRSVVGDTLDFSRIESGRLDVKIAAFDPLTLANEVAASLRLAAESAGVKLHDPELTHARTDRLADENDLRANADPQLVRQVLTNLVSNAIKYNQRDGEVRVSITYEADRVRIDVRDTGLGLGPEQLEKLFQPFNRVGAERSGIPGTGLGLAIARRMCLEMGGDILVESALGEGSTFRVMLPIST